MTTEIVLAQFGDFEIAMSPNAGGTHSQSTDLYYIRDTTISSIGALGCEDVVDMVESPDDNGRAACRIAFYNARRYARARRRKQNAHCRFCQDVGSVFSMGYWRRVPCNYCQPN